MKKLFMSLFSTALRIATGLGMIAIYTNALSFEKFTHLAIGLLCAQITCIFVDGGVNNEILRSARLESTAQNTKRLYESMAARLAVSTAIAICLVIYNLVTTTLDNTVILLASFFSGILSSINETNLVNLKATNRFKDELIKSTTQSVLIISVSCIVFISPTLAALSILSPRIFTTGILLRGVGKNNLKKIRNRISSKSVFGYYTRLKHYTLDSIFSNLGAQLDAILISVLIGKEAFAIYQPTSKVLSSSLNLGGVIGALVIPKATTLHSDKNIKYYLLGSFFVFGLVVAALFFVFCNYFLSILFGSMYSPGLDIEIILTFMIIVRFLAAGAGSYLTIKGQQKKRAIINAICAVSSVIFTVMYSFLYDINIEVILNILLISQIVMMIFYVLSVVKYAEPVLVD
jgi:O-antigen/teichoic acid export membrane protein